MTFEQFKALAKNTNYPFNHFFATTFLRATSIENEVNRPVFAAEVMSKNNHVSLYYPNARGGATLTKGFGKGRSIEFYDDLESIPTNT